VPSDEPARPPTPPPVGVRVARRSQRLEECARFYAEDLRLPQLFAFHDHDGYDGFVFALCGAAVQLELVRTREDRPVPVQDEEDLLILYLADEQELRRTRRRLGEQRGLTLVDSPNPYWHARRAFVVLDPEGRGVMYVVSPDSVVAS
jgi:hypothetical protein